MDPLHVSLNALGMGESLLFLLAHCVLQCSREICDSFIATTGVVFSHHMSLPGDMNPP